MGLITNFKKFRKLKREKPKFFFLETPRVGFIEIPKVASRSINHVLLTASTNEDSSQYDVEKVKEVTEQISKHIKQKEIRMEFSDCYIFSFVRNPYERLVSCYKNKVLNFPREEDYFGYCGIKKDDTLDQFIQKVSQIPDAQADRHFRSQSWFLYDEDKLIPDFVGKLENIIDDWKILLEKFDLPEIPHFNASQKKPLDLSETNKKLIRERYRDDFINFGYEY